MIEQWYKGAPKSVYHAITLPYSVITISWKRFIWRPIAFQRIQKRKKKSKWCEWLKNLLGVSSLETLLRVRLTKLRKNPFLARPPMSQTVQPVKFREYTKQGSLQAINLQQNQDRGQATSAQWARTIKTTHRPNTYPILNEPVVK